MASSYCNNLEQKCSRFFGSSQLAIVLEAVLCLAAAEISRIILNDKRKICSTPAQNKEIKKYFTRDLKKIFYKGKK